MEWFPQEIMSNLQTVTGTIIALAGLLGTVSLCFSAAMRYSRAKAFAIPFRLTYVSIHELIDIFFVVVIIFGVGIIIPGYLFIADIFITDILVAVQLICVIISSFLVYYLLKRPKKENVYIKTTDGYIESPHKPNSRPKGALRILGFALIGLAVIAAIGFLYFYISREIGETNDTWGTIFTIAISLHFFAIAMVGGGYTVSKVLGERISSEKGLDFLTVSIDGVLYLMAMRYSPQQWILIPCDVYGEIIYFTIGRYIIKSIEGKEIMLLESKFIRGTQPGWS